MLRPYKWHVSGHEVHLVRALILALSKVFRVTMPLVQRDNAFTYATTTT